MEKNNTYVVILIIVTGLIGLFFLFDWIALLPIALGVAVISIFSSYAAEKIVWIWNKIALILGAINSRILLSLIFYLFLVPIALISKLFKNKDELLLKRKEGSYYKERNHTYTADDLKNVF